MYEACCSFSVAALISAAVPFSLDALEFGERRLDVGLRRGVELVADFLERFLGRVDQRGRVVADLGLFLLAPVLGRACASASRTIRSTSSLERLVDAVIVICCSLPVPRSLAETFTMPLASMSNVTSTCGTPRGAAGMPFEPEAPERLVVGRHLALALEHVDVDRGLTVFGRREDLRLARRDRRVALDQLRRDAAEGFETQRERGDVEQDDVVDFAGEHAGLDRRADRDDFVGVDATG